MFVPPRFIVVDDREDHLDALLKTFQAMGTACLGIRYDPETPPDPEHFRGVRVLFIDLHLLEGIVGTDETRHFAQIASILEDVISAQGGPYVLVIWTQHPQLTDQLVNYLTANLDEAKPHVRPLAVIPLSKEQFINLETGAPRNAPELREAVEGSVVANAQLAAVLSWESDVLGAAGATLSALLDLIPIAERSTTRYPSALDLLLSRLAIEAVGKPNVPSDRRAAINAALSPILADRIQNQATTAQVEETWNRALTRDQEELANLSASEAGQVNRMLHVASPSSETINARDWGAVVDVPQAWVNDEMMRQRFSGTLGDILASDFKVRAEHQQNCRPMLVRVGAVCDHAQGRRGPIPYLLAMEIPATIGRPHKPPAAEWKSPVLVTDPRSGPFFLIVNCRYLVTASETEVVNWAVRYRLREQLLMVLIQHAAQYVARPGIVSMPS